MTSATVRVCSNLGLYAVPFGSGLAFALLVAIVLVGSQGKLRGRFTRLENNGLGVGTEVTGKVDVVTYVHYSERLAAGAGR